MKHLALILLCLVFIFSCKQSYKRYSTSPLQLKTKHKTVTYLLDSVLITDQMYRMELDTIKNKFGNNSNEIKNHWRKINKTDSSNLVIVERVINTYGWLGPKEIGEKANLALFLVIQHSNTFTQEKYLPIMQKAVKVGKAYPADLALLTDRVKLGKKELQVYGSQIGTHPETGKLYVLPLIDPENVNERRAKVGLKKIEEYISFWGLKWDVQEYNKNLPNYIKILKAK